MNASLFDLPPAQVQEIILRPYQDKAVQSFLAGIDRGVKRGLQVLPTGGGKTTIFTRICQILDVPSLVLAHRGELLSQAADRVRNQAGIITSLEVGKNRASSDSQVIVGSVQALGKKGSRRLAEFSPKLVIIDEAHHAAASTYQNAMHRFGCYVDDVWTLGVTATPHRMDNKPLHGTDKAIFQEILFAYTLKEAILDGWLANLRGYRVKTDVDLTNIKATGNGDYNQGDLQKAVNTHARNEAGFTHWAAVAGRRKTIVFCSGVDHAKDVADLYRQNGVKAEAVDGSMNQDRRDGIMARFKSGQTQVLTNVDIATEGFDVPDTSCVLLLRPTKSWALFTQMVGRGLRVLPNTVEGLPDASARRDSILASDKPDCIVIEVVDEDRKVSENQDGQNGIGDAPTIAGIVDLPPLLDLDGHGLAEAIELFEELTPTKKAYISRREVSFGDLSTTLTEVDMIGELAIQDEVLNLSSYAWLKISAEEYILPCGSNETKGEADRLARLHLDALGSWWVEFTSSTMNPEVFLAGDDLQRAFKQADGRVRGKWPFLNKLIDHQAEWRNLAPSAAHLRYLRALEVDEDVISLIQTAGQAASLIEQQKRARAA